MKFKFKFEFQQTNSMTSMYATNIKPLIILEKQIMFFLSYTIFPIKKINVGKILKLRENPSQQRQLILSKHVELLIWQRHQRGQGEHPDGCVSVRFPFEPPVRARL
jgi:hypothetical protein